MERDSCCLSWDFRFTEESGADGSYGFALRIGPLNQKNDVWVGQFCIVLSILVMVFTMISSIMVRQVSGYLCCPRYGLSIFGIWICRLNASSGRLLSPGRGQV